MVMISVAEAKRKIIENCPAPKIIQVPLAGAGGFVLAENLFAPWMPLIIISRQWMVMHLLIMIGIENRDWM